MGDLIAWWAVLPKITGTVARLGMIVMPITERDQRTFCATYAEIVEQAKGGVCSLCDAGLIKEISLVFEVLAVN